MPSTTLVDDGVVSLHVYDGPPPRLPLCMCGGGLCPEDSVSLISPARLEALADTAVPRMGRVLAHIRSSASAFPSDADSMPWCREVSGGDDREVLTQTSLLRGCTASSTTPADVVVSSTSAGGGGSGGGGPHGPKTVASAAVDAMENQLITLSSAIHGHPELNFQEEFAHNAIANFVETDLGLPVDRAYLGISTAFRCQVGHGSPRVAICAEYDALPEIGHACGHNLIAEAAVAAFLGAHAALQMCNPSGTVILLGTPAEEGGGGKVELLNRGAFEDIDCAMMVHPAPTDGLYPNQTACECCRVQYRGKNAHAAAFPFDGVNALDAVVQAFVNIGLMRQQMRPEWRVSGIITKGGVKTNIIPDHCEAEFQIRAPTREQLRELKHKVADCLRASAVASGCEVEIEWSPPDVLPHPYDEMVSNAPMCEAFRANIATLPGANVPGVGGPSTSSAHGTVYMSAQEEAKLPGGSTDMGNVSHSVPAIHPKFAIETQYSNHHPGFTQYSNLPDAHKQAIRAGKAMALTTLDILDSPKLLKEIQNAFDSVA